VRAEIENVSRPDSLRRLGSNNHGNIVNGAGEDLSEESLFASGSVLEVNQQPIETAQRTDFRGEC
jgi:hypothetical protein